MTVSVDVSELRLLGTVLGRVPDHVQRGIRPIVQKGAVEVKNKMRDDMRESPSFRGVANTISFDVKADGGGVEAQIGPSPTSLTNIAYFGGSRGGGATVDILGPLAEEADPFENALRDLVGDLL